MATLGTLEYLISINDSKINSGLKNSESKVKKFGDKVSSWAVAKGQLLGRFVEQAGRATMNFVKGSVQESMTFDKTMSQVAATLGKSTQEVEELSKFARKMGAETAFSATEAAQGLNYMALAGYDTQTSMKMLPTVLNLAAAGNMDLARASDMVTDAQSALGLSIEETEDMVDQMAKTSSKTNTSVEQLGEAFLTVGGSAKNLKGGTMELSALLGVLANNGIKGAEGGTALRNVLTALSNPAGKAAKELDKLGVKAYDVQGNLKSMPEIFNEFNKAIGGKTMQERTEIFAKMFNVRDLKSIEALLSMTAEDWGELMYEIDNAPKENSAEKMAKTQLENLSGDVTKFKSALGETKLAIIEGLTPSLRRFVQRGTTWVNRLTEAFKENGLSGALKESGKILKEAFGDAKNWAKLKLSDYVGVGSDASWSEIASGLVKKVTRGLKNKKIKIAEWLDIPNAADASWADITGKIIQGLTSKIKAGGDFLMRLILGSDYAAEGKNKSTWQDVGTKISTWINDGLKEGGFVDTFLKNFADKVDTIAGIIGKAIIGLAEWIGKNPDTIVDIITNIANSIAKAAGPIVDALGKILASPELWASLGRAAEGIIEAIFGEGSLQSLKTFFGIKDYDTTPKTQRRGKQIYQALKEQENAVEYMNKSFGNTAEAMEAIGLFKKVQDAGKNGARISDEDLAELYASLSRADEASGGVVSNLAQLSDDAMTAKEHITALFKDVNENFENRSLDKYTEFLTEYLEDAGLAGEELEDALGKLDFNNLKKILDEKGAEEFGKIFNETLNGILGEQPLTAPVDPVLGDTSSLESALKGLHYTIPVSPSWRIPWMHQAKGDWNVPFDNYPSLLHRGEMVLTKSQARNYREGNTAGTTEIIGALQSLRNDMQNLKIVVGEKTFGRAVVDYGAERVGRFVGANDSRVAAGYGA